MNSKEVRGLLLLLVSVCVSVAAPLTFEDPNFVTAVWAFAGAAAVGAVITVLWRPGMSVAMRSLLASPIRKFVLTSAIGAVFGIGALMVWSDPILRWLLLSGVVVALLAFIAVLLRNAVGQELKRKDSRVTELGTELAASERDRLDAEAVKAFAAEMVRLLHTAVSSGPAIRSAGAARWLRDNLLEKAREHLRAGEPGAAELPLIEIGVADVDEHGAKHLKHACGEHLERCMRDGPYANSAPIADVVRTTALLHFNPDGHTAIPLQGADGQHLIAFSYQKLQRRDHEILDVLSWAFPAAEVLAQLAVAASPPARSNV